MRSIIQPNVFWYHPDHLGGTDLMTDAAGELQDAYSEYLSYGGPLTNAANNTSGNYAGRNTPDTTIDRSGGFQFTDQGLDDADLYYFHSRYFDPTIGRFLEEDRGSLGLTPQDFNDYAYVSNSPLRYVDPTAQQAEEPLAQANVDLSCCDSPLSPPPLVNASDEACCAAASQPSEWANYPEPKTAIEPQARHALTAGDLADLGVYKIDVSTPVTS